MRRISVIVVLLLLSDAFFAQRTEALIVDDFSVGPIAFSNTPVPQTQTGLDPAHVLNGGRDMGMSSNNDSISLDTNLRTFTYTSGSSSIGHQLVLGYGNVSSPLNLDLTANGNTGIALDFLSATPNATLPLVGVFTTSNFSVGRAIRLTKLPSAADGSFRAVGDFSPLLALGFDLKHVGRIDVATENNNFPRNNSLVLRGISLVPEPASSSILVCGAAAVILLGRFFRG